MSDHLQRVTGVKRINLKEMYPYRRHAKSCPHFDKGNDWLRCRCPLWVGGNLNGQQVRRSLKTRNLDVAWKEIDRLEKSGKVSTVLNASDAIEAWVESTARLSIETRRRYKRIARYLTEFLESRGIRILSAVSVPEIDQYLKSRKDKSQITLRKELEIIQAIFAWAKERGWASENPVKASHMPEEVPVREVIPYTSEEIISMIRACDDIGQSFYERSRAKAALLLMRFYGLRISDVATFRRDAVKEDKILLRARKNSVDLYLPLYSEVKEALDCLPLPDGCEESPYYFWTGTSSILSVKSGIWRTLKSAFRISGVKKAHPHRFRHTLATEILIAGGSIEDVANILGDSPAVVRKHYIRWCRKYQERTTKIFASVHCTKYVHLENEGSKLLKMKGVGVVAREGIEPPTRGFSVRCSTN